MPPLFTSSGGLLDAAKQAALDAVAGYAAINAYTIGVAVQAAASVLRQDAYVAPVEARARDAWDVESREVTPRVRALEGIASAARALPHDHVEGCKLCDALAALEQAS
ncbi:MAG TPA: hypothetical protein VHN98_08300 [Acidimicrobiales bacterium]|nr:hypothetical protein [Acidimicrobiales bacterium]